MTPLQLRAAGEALYGARWQSALARALGVHERTVQRWFSGARGVPQGLPDDLAALAEARAAALAELVAELRR